jgi:methionine-rich copper-binding protein CopC
MFRLTNSLLSRAALLASLGCATLVLGAATHAPESPARFHVALVKAVPKQNDTLLASPKAIKLWFSESVQAGATALRLTGANGATIQLGKVTVAAAAKSPAISILARDLAPGRYTLDWRTMADDGHPAKGTLSFVVR